MTLHSKTLVRRQPITDFSVPSDAARAALHPLLHRVLRNRGIKSIDELDHSLKLLHAPSLLKGIDVACELLIRAIEHRQSILIVGDYDVDGATAAAVAILGLKLLTAEAVDYRVPNRFDYGYGLSAGFAKVVLQAKPDLVITVDNGISSVEGIALLRRADIAVIVTDHHLAGDALPDANAIVNPNQPGCEFPSKALAGVGVMFYVLLAVRSAMRAGGWFQSRGIAPPNLACLLDLVALGTVADLAPLDHNNRIMVAQGIARIQQGACRPGITALFRVAGKDHTSMASSDLGFIIAPRLNAAGRLDDISLGIECLLADDIAAAEQYAKVLHAINAERRQLQQQMQLQAIDVVNAMALQPQQQQAGLCLYNDSWHQGIIGLVASRLKEHFDQPALVFAKNSSGSLVGSARSVPGLHIRDLLEQIATVNPDLIEKFGGHAMAAGLTIAANDFDLFATAFHSGVTAHFANQPPSNQVFSDGPLEAAYFSEAVAEMLRNAAPWGQLFPPPVFDNRFKVLTQRLLSGQHLKMQLALDNIVVDAIVFGYLQPGQELPRLDAINAVYRLEINQFRGVKSLQLVIEHLQPI